MDAMAQVRATEKRNRRRESAQRILEALLINPTYLATIKQQQTDYLRSCSINKSEVNPRIARLDWTVARDAVAFADALDAELAKEPKA
jgi:hypothetical protein